MEFAIDYIDPYRFKPAASKAHPARLRLIDPETTAKAANFWTMEIEAFRDQKDRKTIAFEYLYRVRKEITTKDTLPQFELSSFELLKVYDRQPLRKKETSSIDS